MDQVPIQQCTAGTIATHIQQQCAIHVNRKKHLTLRTGTSHFRAMGTGKKVDRCRPGYNASCALCCGSHNYISSPDIIDSIFRTRGSIFRKNLPLLKQGAITPHQMVEKLGEAGEPLKFTDAMQCPYTAYRGENDKVLSCLAYGDTSILDPGLCSFFTRTCKNFFCSAWHLLTDEEVLFAARLTRDWFFYSLLISDIAFLKKNFRSCSSMSEIPQGLAHGIKHELLIRHHIRY